MIIRNASNPKDVKQYDTQRLREEFLIDGLFQKGEILTVYSHVDRIITGSACPVTPLTLEAGKELACEYFLERREMGIINIGADGAVIVDGVKYELKARDGLYIGKGNKEILFESADASNPAKFYFNSTPAHQTYPVTKIDITTVEAAKMGSDEECNKRTIYKYIHPAGVQSCQLVMGLTQLEPGSVWNTMPCHTHDRRMEVYLYFDIADTSVVFHYMGEPTETRHIVVRNEQAVISPSWSIHSGCGTKNYTFIWGMAGENQTFSDMDMVDIKDLK
ncbi:MAG: 5-dehydro-4-deoxy-D-glucuronate isomerase [Clostridiales bacterium 43-6]|nr:MAG: 5-dehydro-4-deoxy-D-glucuronate isomerase [Clostridiales bacterium 43-6]